MDSPTDNSLEQKVFDEKVKAFSQELEQLQQKHGIRLIPVLKSIPVPGMPGAGGGIVPDVVYMDQEAFNKMTGSIQPKTPIAKA